MTKVDDNTVEIDTTKPRCPRSTVLRLGDLSAMPSTSCPSTSGRRRIRSTFDNYPPVTISPYKLKDPDPNGYWFLWEKRDDWQRTDVGQIIGEPKPKYVLFRSYGAGGEAHPGHGRRTRSTS